MSIVSLSIRNYKSIKKLDVNFDQNNSAIHCFLGKNGAGKSNLLNALNYFYENLDGNKIDANALDNVNPYNRNCKISITFNLEHFKHKVTTEYLQEIFEEINDAFHDDESYEDDGVNIKIKKITLTMTQNKSNMIKWNTKNIKVLKHIKFLFPFYYINTRHLDIYTWERVWEIISDLSSAKTDKTDEEINTILDSAFKNIYGPKYEKSVEIVSNAFDKSKVMLDKYHFDSRYKNTFMMRFGGENFIYIFKTIIIINT